MWELITLFLNSLLSILSEISFLSDFKEHFLEHVIDGKIEISQQLKKLRVLETILLNSCVLKDIKKNTLKLDDGCLKNILLIQNQIRDIYKSDPEKFCFKNVNLD